MSHRAPQLPSFAKPPLTEVALGVQFSALTSFRSVHLGGLWREFAGEFPKVVEKPPLDPAFETFGTPIAAPTVRFHLLPGPPLPRLWLLDSRDVELIQFQPDRFLHNWRKAGEGIEYPRYEGIRDRFLRELERLATFLKANELGALDPNQCEVTYVNQITPRPGEDLQSNLGTVFRMWVDDAMKNLSVRYEDSRFVSRFVIASDAGEPIGRVMATAEPGKRADGVPIIQFTLTGRGRPREPTIEGVGEFLNVAREKVAEVFLTLTTDEMHRRWERTE